ncbi:tRNA (adenosine(37)-N6)-threonylcarbamoyltransferase complex ATPase subunit type 1 TsaE [Prochlorothrix hollandica]|uniref:tRNA (adenosine(37)-N6)-threonylcarbamoyltransferase complex ATPase subunit type 1 TsaE n=1 Tax=Prochlorothrix hollandica TaxID=1223 RepID=UPI0003481677|nr:tRNA (adenosine(37)-N6)-threonylcarbamoyltransferase complex ATPase subunit type 1 TsaE [Prochlorothrix hollandica]
MDSFSPSLTLPLPDAAATLALGRVLGQQLPVGTVLLLRGDLGSGKTTLVQGLGQGLGITEAIVSPTFTLVAEYQEGRVPLYHFDLYRLPNQAEAGDLDRLGLDLYWDGDEVEPGIVAIEWSERLSHLPPQSLVLTLSPTADDGRLAHFHAPQDPGRAILQTLDPLLRLQEPHSS